MNKAKAGRGRYCDMITPMSFVFCVFRMSCPVDRLHDQVCHFFPIGVQNVSYGIDTFDTIYAYVTRAYGPWTSISQIPV